MSIGKRKIKWKNCIALQCKVQCKRYCWFVVFATCTSDEIENRKWENHVKYMLIIANTGGRNKPLTNTTYDFTWRKTVVFFMDKTVDSACITK